MGRYGAAQPRNPFPVDQILFSGLVFQEHRQSEMEEVLLPTIVRACRSAAMQSAELRRLQRLRAVFRAGVSSNTDREQDVRCLDQGGARAAVGQAQFL